MRSILGWIREVLPGRVAAIMGVINAVYGVSRNLEKNLLGELWWDQILAYITSQRKH